MSDWQPIETAPKDGTQILLFCPVKRHESHPANFIFVGWWFSSSKEIDDGWRADQGWFPSEWLPVTNWMPLPPPPKTEPTP